MSDIDIDSINLNIFVVKVNGWNAYSTRHFDFRKEARGLATNVFIIIEFKEDATPYSPPAKFHTDFDVEIFKSITLVSEITNDKREFVFNRVDSVFHEKKDPSYAAWAVYDQVHETPKQMRPMELHIPIKFKKFGKIIVNFNRI